MWRSLLHKLTMEQSDREPTVIQNCLNDFASLANRIEFRVLPPMCMLVGRGTFGDCVLHGFWWRSPSCFQGRCFLRPPFQLLFRTWVQDGWCCLLCDMSWLQGWIYLQMKCRRQGHRRRCQLCCQDVNNLQTRTSIRKNCRIDNFFSSFLAWSAQNQRPEHKLCQRNCYWHMKPTKRLVSMPKCRKHFYLTTSAYHCRKWAARKV